MISTRPKIDAPEKLTPNQLTDSNEKNYFDLMNYLVICQKNWHSSLIQIF